MEFGEKGFGSYSCEFYFISNTNILFKCSNTACWAGIGQHIKIKNVIYPNSLLKENNYILNDYIKSKSYGDRYDKLSTFGKNQIYISKYDKFEETKKYIPLLVSTINKITPCKIVKLKSGTYIKYTFIKGEDTYDKNLILLNFIRNLWCSQYTRYSLWFFESLEANKSIEDPIELLTTANKYACNKHNKKHIIYYDVGHSNCISEESKIKTLKDFEEYTNNSTCRFFKENSKYLKPIEVEKAIADEQKTVCV